MTVPAAPPRRPSRWRRWARVVLGLGAAALAAWAVAGRSDELSGATAYFAHLDWGWLAVAVVAELVSYVAFANMQRRLLRAGSLRPGLTPVTGITLAGNAIQNSLPAGVVLSAAFAYRQYHRLGADDVLSGWVIVTMTTLSLMTLSALAAAGLALAASEGSSQDLVSAIVGITAVMGVLVVAWARRAWLVGRAAGAVRFTQRLVRRPRGDADELVAVARRRLGAIAPSRRDWAMAAAMAAANWILDLACLVAAFLAVNASVPWRGLLLAYAAAQLASNLPVTPGGLGVVEGSLTIALVAFGGAEASTVAAVLMYRLCNYWMMLPIGWGSWGWLTVRARRRPAAAVAAEVAR